MFPDWRVGDLVTHGDGDVHRVEWTDAEDGALPDEIEVVCVWPSRDGKCERGDRELNTVWAFDLVRRFVSEEPAEEPIKRRA